MVGGVIICVYCETPNLILKIEPEIELRVMTADDFREFDLAVLIEVKENIERLRAMKAHGKAMNN